MSETVNIGILEATAIIHNEISGVVTTMRRDIQDFVDKSEDNFKVLGAAAGIVTGALTAVAGGIVALGVRGSDVSDIRSEFDGLTSSVGLSADALTSRLTQATDGIVSKFDLMKTANRGLTQGLRLSVDDFGLLGESARVLADRIGGDTLSTFEALTMAMANGRTRGLKAYGIDVIELNEKLKEAGTGLSEYQRLHVTQKAILEQLGRVTKESGDVQLDFNDKIARASATFQNLNDDIGVAVANSPVLATVMDTVGNAIESAFGGDQQSRVNEINKLVSQFAIFVVDAAGYALEFGRAGVNAFYGVRAGLFALLEGLFNAEVKMRELQIATLEYANSIPGLRGNFDGMLQSARDSQQVADAMRVSFQTTKESALDSAQSMNSGIDSVKGTLSRMRDEMVKASESTVSLDRVTRAARTAAEDHAASERSRAEALKRSAEETAKFNSALQQLGLISETQVVTKLTELNAMFDKSISAGVSYEAATKALGVALQNLAAQAKNSGIQVAALDGALTLFNDTINSTVDAGFERELEFTNEQLIEMQGGLQQVNFEAIQSRIAADQLTASYRSFGLKTPMELQAVAEASRRNYEILKASGTATAEQLKLAYRQMVDDQTAATGRIPGVWSTVVVPGVTAALQNLQTAVSGTFAQMAMGAKDFEDGFRDIWNSIKATAINIFNDIAEAFINGALKRMIGALAGSNNSFASGIGRMMGGGNSAGGGGINWGAIAGRGGTTTAAMGWGGASSNAGVAAAGMGLGTGSGTAAGAGVAAAGSGAAGTGTAAGGVAGTGMSSAVIGTAVGVAGAAVAGVGMGMLGKKLFGGAGVQAGTFGAASGAAAGAVIGSVVPVVGTAVGAIVGGVAGGLAGMIGVSKKELQGRGAVAEIEDNIRASLDATQQAEAGGERWKEILIGVRDTYLAVGMSSEQAEADVKKLWESSKGGLKAVEAAVAPIQEAYDKLAAQNAPQETAESTEATAEAAAEGVPAFGEMKDAMQETRDAALQLREILGTMPSPKYVIDPGSVGRPTPEGSSSVVPASASSSMRATLNVDGRQMADVVINHLGSRAALRAGGGR